MTDRHEQARAEAERRVRDLENRNIYGPANSVGYLVGHAEGVEWADANPQPRTIATSEELGALPTGSIILSDKGHAWQKCPKRERMSEAGWVCADPIYPGIYNDPVSQRGAIFYRGPATVLYQPEVRDE